MLEVLISALIAVESGGNPNAIGDHGKALGVLQIHSEVVMDVNQFFHTNYTHHDMLDPVKAKDVAEKYLLY